MVNLMLNTFRSAQNLFFLFEHLFQPTYKRKYICVYYAARIKWKLIVQNNIVLKILEIQLSGSAC
jgi:hypothetical protein